LELFLHILDFLRFVSIGRVVIAFGILSLDRRGRLLNRFNCGLYLLCGNPANVVVEVED